jgi:N-acetylglucosamine-6-phosphate deacetylase
VAVPGFVDLQVNGFGGVDLPGADAAGYATAGAALLATGTTAFQPTFVSAPVEALVDALASMPAGGIGPRVLGAHLEGPFLSPLRLGAHAPEHRRDPDLALLEQLLEAGPVRQVTLAPELPGALGLIDALVERGITVSVGHTDATAAAAHAAFDRGARTVTHLHNAMRPGTPREPGVATVALARTDVVVQVIVDGHHLAPDTVRLAWRAAAGRLALVTDAAAPAAAPAGEYRLGGRSVQARDGIVRGPEGQLAGSALTMLDAVRNLHALGVRLEDAAVAAAAVPAALAGRPDLGRLEPGAAADVVVLDDRLDISRVLVGGDLVHTG